MRMLGFARASRMFILLSGRCARMASKSSVRFEDAMAPSSAALRTAWSWRMKSLIWRRRENPTGVSELTAKIKKDGS
jgi:hypothetical protein